MLHLFRKIRGKAADHGKTGRYFRYAFGEILLIVIGIIIALQLQNWNEKRKQEALFTSNLEQIYNSLKNEIELFDGAMEILVGNINTIDFIFAVQDSIKLDNIPNTEKQQLIAGLFSVTTPPINTTYEVYVFSF